MKFLLYAQVAQNTVDKQLGTADYSYFFLLRAFAHVCAALGDVIQLREAADADLIHAQCASRNEPCVLLSFAPPHKTPLGLACPTVPVFAWEYPDIPERIEEASWMDDPRHDWRNVFALTGRAITLSSHTVDAVKRSMGERFPIVAIPAPIRSIAWTAAMGQLPDPSKDRLLIVNASVADSRCMGLDVAGLVCLEEEDGTGFDPADAHILPISPALTQRTSESDITSPAMTTEPDEPEDGSGESAPLGCGWDLPPAMPIRIRLRGLVYTAVLTPTAGRKNWEDLITAFCWTFRDDENVTLILKLAGTDLQRHHHQLLMLLTKLSPLKCRVIAINCYLSDEDYAALVGATTYYVNASLCEGLCLPLVEFLSEGVPAIAPDNTAMADYIRDDLAFVVASYPGIPTVWPHGDNEVNRTSYHQLDWESLTTAFRRSHEVAHHDPARYRQMSRHACEAMQAYCGPETVKSQLHAFLCPGLPVSDQHQPDGLPAAEADCPVRTALVTP
ncbi:MAG TPA: glycosyltransferase [Rhodanobacter sp.]